MYSNYQDLVVLGDSVFDNQVYLEHGQNSVKDHFEKKLLPLNFNLDHRAIDGSIIHDVYSQLTVRPIISPSIFVLSIGGNDALTYANQNELLEMNLFDFYEMRENFRTQYAHLLDAILEYTKQLIICTIYNPKFEDPVLQKIAETGLSFFNDVIIEEAMRRKIYVIDLRDVCSDRCAFANPIEPSEHGGDLITSEIIRVMSKTYK